MCPTLPQVVGEEGFVLERSDTGDVITTEEHWQVIFDLVVDDWHSKGKLGGEMRLVAVNREPQSVRSSTSPVKLVGTGKYDMPAYFGEITLLVNTLTMDDKRFGRWGKNGPEKLKFRDARDMRNKKKDASVRKKNEKVVVLRGMEKIERLDHLSQYLCNHFGMVPLWNAFDVLRSLAIMFLIDRNFSLWCQFGLCWVEELTPTLFTFVSTTYC